MKALKFLLVMLITLGSIAVGVMYFLNKETARDYIDIYGEDESIY